MRYLFHYAQLRVNLRRNNFPGNALYYFYKNFFKGSLNIAKEHKFYIFEKNTHKTLTEKSFR
jgi:hypothetical protein